MISQKKKFPFIVLSVFPQFIGMKMLDAVSDLVILMWLTVTDGEF